MSNPEHSDQKDSTAAWWYPSLVLFWRLSVWIGGPIVVALIVGQWLDKKYGTKPWLFLVCVGSAFILSSIGIVREASKAMIEIANDAQSQKKKPKKIGKD